MLLRHRGMLTLLTLVALASVTIGGGLWLVTAQVDPATASRGQLMRHLVLADLSAEPTEVKVAWVDRLQLELTSDLTSTGAETKLSPRYRQRLAQNLGVLQEVWFQTRTAQYALLPQEKREAFMVDQLAVVGAWAKVASLVSDEPVAPDVATRALIERIEQWVDAASGPQRDAMALAVKDGTLCWLAMTDLETQSLGVKRELAVRFAKELNRGAQPQVASLVTDAPRRARLAKNAAQLVEAYIYTLAETYSALEPNERLPFIDEQLAAVERWGIANLLASASSDAAPSKSSAVAALATQSQQWIEHAPEEQREEVRKLVTAVQQRMVWRQLPVWLRGS